MSYSMSKIGVSGHPNIGIDDLLNDELPDYSSRRSSFSTQYVGDQKIINVDKQSEANRKISTASNTLEVPGSRFLDRQNSLTSTLSLVSNSSVGTFSYQNFRRPKIRYSFGSFIILIGLCLLVIGICLLIFGDNTSPIDNQSNAIINNNQTNNTAPNHTDSHTSALTTVGYFLLFSGILIILVGISIIFCINSEINESPQNPQQENKLERRVSTIEIEPPLNVVETAIAKPEIMITPDSIRDDVSYRKFPTPNFMTRPKISIEETTDDHFPKQLERRFPF